ncbi:MAG: RrF2 family transcriptional regulator [Phycisphaerae bacterium]
MLSQTAQYALRGLVYVAEHGVDAPVLAEEIAKKTGVPRQYLSSILRKAVRAGLLKSTRGKGGGFQLARARSRIRLLEVLRLFDDVVARAACPFGQARCSDENPCIFHDYWKPVATAYGAMLESTTLEDVVLSGRKAGRVGRSRRRT